ncbi:hypothetical protein ACLMJK_002053 [Lecanora helva]
MDLASTVKIEYTDPSGILTSFAREFLPRLPLKDLHWSSSSRPTRSIGSLHIELVSDEGPKFALAHASADDTVIGQDNGGATKYEGSRKERRHQIPGLRRTPYLKVYLVSCNDVDTYKGSFRKPLKEWVKDNNPSSRSSAVVNKQDNHDAFEWLIIHVVPASPDEAGKPSRPVINQGDVTTEKRPSSSRWSSRASTSVIEKIRSDVNSTSKGAIDRVTQIQLVDSPKDSAGQGDRQIQDRTNGWDDFLSKLKLLILASFDLRVRQYEDDIKEREGQKKVFGWNFNTFFVLKEGLAMGFENMGLLEDALTVYQELAFGLQSAIDEQQAEGAQQQTAHFVGYTEDLYQNFEETGAKSRITKAAVSQEQRSDLGASLLKTDRKLFRDLILSNKISVFDFQCYVFARQFTLSLRLTNISNNRAHLVRTMKSLGSSSGDNDYGTSGSSLAKPSDYEPENLLLLADIARSSTDFITSTTGTIRQDIQLGIRHAKTSANESGESAHYWHDEEIENFCMSWLFSTSQCILEETCAQSLTSQLSPLLHQLESANATPETVADNDRAGSKGEEADRKDLPVRTSSLFDRTPKGSYSPAHQRYPAVNFLDAAKLLTPSNPHPGSKELAAARGDLIALRRRILANIGTRNGIWENGKSASVSDVIAQDEDMQEIDLDGESFRTKSAKISVSSHIEDSPIAGLCNTDLLKAVASIEDFSRVYESLTVSALAHYVVGGRTKAAEAMIADLAIVRCQLKDYRSAASYFRQLAPFYANSDWDKLEVSMLDMYAQCLKQFDQKDDFVRVSLKILAKIIKETFTVKGDSGNQRGDPRGLQHELNVAKGYLASITATSKTCNTEFSAPLEDYFSNIYLEKYIDEHTEKDGFELHLHLRSLLPTDLLADSIQVKLLKSDADHRSELFFATEQAQAIKPGLARIPVRSKTTEQGWFALDKIYIKSSNVCFVLDLSPTIQRERLFPRHRDSVSSILSNDASDTTSILLWPKNGGLNLSVAHYEVINLERSNSIRVVVKTGRNSIVKSKLILRAASAGLRIHTAEAQALENDNDITDKSQPGSICITNLTAYTEVSITIPYTIESDLRDINVRATLEYSTPYGDFAFACNATLSILLPLAINVQDIFKETLLVSKFTIGTSGALPVRLYNCRLEGNTDFRVALPPWQNEELDVFIRQPLSFVAHIHRQRDGSTSPKRKLFLKVEFRCLDGIIQSTVERRFHNALELSPHVKYSRVLGPALLADLQTRMAGQDIESICLLREINIGTFDEWRWKSLLARLSPQVDEGLEKFLRRWHEENRKIPLDDGVLSMPMQYLTVPVDIPNMQVVHTARLRRVAASSTPPQLDTVPAGREIPMELTISHTRSWDSQRMDDRALEFCYEIQANADVWIVGGQKRAHFSSVENAVSRFPLILWPQKTGHLMLPSLEVHSLRPSPDQSDEENTTVSEMSCELDYQNAGESILVVPDLIQTTVSLDPSGHGGAWLVDSRRRSP